MKDKRDIWVPLEKKKTTNTHNSEEFERKETDRTRFRKERSFFLIFFSFLFFLRFTKIGLSEFVGPGTKSSLRDEGYAWVPKTWDFIENSGKNSKNPNFWFFSDLRRSNGQNFSDQ